MLKISDLELDGAVDLEEEIDLIQTEICQLDLWMAGGRYPEYQRLMRTKKAFLMEVVRMKKAEVKKK